MSLEKDKQSFVQFINEIGYNIGENMVQNVDLQLLKSFNFLPELAVFIASYVVKKTFTRRTAAPGSIKNSICFYFKNVFEDNKTVSRKGKLNTRAEAPCVHVFPASYSRISHFTKGSRVNVVTVFISADYLESFLKDDIDQFQFLFENRHDFLIEEIMTDDIVRTVNDIVKKEEPDTLKGYHYKLKAMELIFYLFQSLSRRETYVHQKLRESDIKAIYKVRDKLISSLDKPTPIEDLTQIAGLNELKMRKIFIQVFGMGIYDYYQHFRMKEAARLMREEKLSVSEAGYRMGFENLSHFSRVFEKHIGKKPKKYSSQV